MSEPSKRAGVIAELDNSLLEAIRRVESQSKIKATLEEIAEGCSDTILKNFVQRDSRKELTWTKIAISITKTHYEDAKWVKVWNIIKNSDVDNRP